MLSIIIGSLVLSILHALIPNHWLPIIAIGRKEEWTKREVTGVTLAAALAHGLSTVLIGILLAAFGSALAGSLQQFTHWIAPLIFILLGLLFIYRHHRHKHFHLSGIPKAKSSKKQLVFALVLAMFLSPCIEIEAYFLLAGAHSYWLVAAIAALYLLVTTAGMLWLVSVVYRGLLKLNWHALEHNAGIITGVVLIITGLVTFIIN